MLDLKSAKDNFEEFRPYIKEFGGIFNDLTLATRYCWSDYYRTFFTVINGTLIAKDNNGFSDGFYFPVGKDVEGALLRIEEYCAERGEDLVFGFIDEDTLKRLTARYGNISATFSRDWCDYIYTAEQFKTYGGKKLSGQRNHVNKFRKLYNGAEFCEINAENKAEVKAFLREYEKENEFTQGIAEKEEERVYVMLDRMEYLNNFGAFIRINGKIAAVSVGEIVGDTLFVHVEKGLKEYAGVYPVMAQAFVRRFAGENVKFVNREEDCGDMGLRISKTQYHPLEIRRKYRVKIPLSARLAENVGEIKTDRLTVSPLIDATEEDYVKLFNDAEINRLYGDDLSAEFGNKTPSGKQIAALREKQKKESAEFSFTVRREGKLVGEIVLYGFGYYGETEIGFRFFAREQGKGYATESLSAFIPALFNAGFKTLKCRHFKENARSQKLIEKLGFTVTGESSEHIFYEKRA